MRVIGAFLILLVSQGVSAPVLATEQPTVLIGTGEFPPRTTNNATNQGCALEIVRRAYENEGWKVTYRFMPWTRNLKMLSEGAIDASAYWMDRSDRRNNYIFPENPLTKDTYRFVFTRDNLVEWTQYGDLTGKTIILNKSYTYPTALLSAMDNFDIASYETFQEDGNLELLLRGRGDLTILEENVIAHYLNELSPQERARLVVDDQVAFANNGFLLFTKNRPRRSEALARVFDTGFTKIKAQADAQLKSVFESCNINE